MNEQPLLKEENLLITKELEAQPSATQRHLSTKLGISSGKTNYLLKELIKKSIIKEGLEHKVQLMQYFLKPFRGKSMKNCL